MSAYQNHSKEYTAADIRNYYKGLLPPEEMHAMEKASLEDPFLADAMEGMQMAMEEEGDEAVGIKLDSIGKELAARTTVKQPFVLSFRWWQVAAAILIMAGATTWLLLKNEDPTNNRSLAVIEKSEAKADTPQNVETWATEPADSSATTGPVTGRAKNKPDNNNTVADTQSQTAALTNKSSTSTSVHKTKIPSPVRQDAAPLPAPPPPPEESEKVDEELPAIKKRKEEAEPVISHILTDTANLQTNIIGGDTKKLINKYNEAANRVIVANKLNADPALYNFISGKVTGENNLPLPNARLNVYKDQKSYFTDKAGFFKIPASDSMLNVSVSMAGYTPKQFTLSNNSVALNQLQLLKDSSALGEVVMIRGYSNQKKADITGAQAPMVLVQQAQPVYGWMAYQQYLENNRKLPASADRKGDVVVSFQVNQKGHLSSFKVEQSMGNPYDKEAIRLIKEGPPWKLLQGRKSRVTVIVRY